MKFICQACGFEAINYRIQRDKQVHEWTLHTIPSNSGNCEILTCPECTKLDIDLIIEKHRARIRKGFDPTLH